MKSWQVVLFAIVVAVVATYSNSFDNGFHFDDSHSIVDNPAVRSVGNIGRFFTDATTSSVLPANQTYRPVVSTSLAIDYALGHGYVPAWFHISTFLIFLAQLLAMYALFVTLGKKASPKFAVEPVALFAVAWYGLSPAIAETVNYIVQRADIYSTFFVLVALVAYARSAIARKTGLYLAPFVVALLSKPPAVVFPILLFVYVWYFEEHAKRDRVRAAALRSLPARGFAIAALVFYHIMIPPTFTPTALPASSYLVIQPYVLLRYALALFFPFNLSVDSDLAPIGALSQNALLGDLFLAGVIAAIVWTARRPSLAPASFGLAWFVIADIPTAVFPLSELENDHRMFFPFVGLVFAVSWLVATFVAAMAARTYAPPIKTLRLATFALLGLCAFGVHERNEVWHDEGSLWADAVRKSPNNGRAWMNLGLVEMNAGRYAAAKTDFDRAVVLTPNYPLLEINLGILAAAMKEPGAERHFERAIALAPQDDATHAFYARYLLQNGRAYEALPEAEIAVRLNVADLAARATLAQSASADGDPDLARRTATETLRIAPGDTTALAVLAAKTSSDPAYWLGLSSSAFGQSRYGDAVRLARHAIVIRPAYADAYNNIGAAEASLHHWTAAVEADRRAVALQPNLQLAKNNLAWALAHVGAP